MPQTQAFSHFGVADVLDSPRDLNFQKLLEQGVRVGLETVVFMESQHSVYEFWFSCFIMGCLRLLGAGGGVMGDC